MRQRASEVGHAQVLASAIVAASAMQVALLVGGTTNPASDKAGSVPLACARGACSLYSDAQMRQRASERGMPVCSQGSSSTAMGANAGAALPGA